MVEKFKNYGLWVSLFALAGLLLKDFSLLPANYDLYVQTIMAILIAAGIVSNPSQGKGFKDGE